MEIRITYISFGNVEINIDDYVQYEKTKQIKQFKYNNNYVSEKLLTGRMRVMKYYNSLIKTILCHINYYKNINDFINIKTVIND